MSMEPKEHLSQLMDGEIGGDTGRFVLRRLEASGELRQTWARYHLIRDCLRRQEWGVGSSTLSARVQQALLSADESQEQSANNEAQRNRWLRPVAGLAVAATVAFMAVFSVAPYLSSGGNNGVSQVAESSTESFTSPNIPGAGPATRPASLTGGSQAGQNKLNDYILRHHQVAGATGTSGFVSFVPIVAATSVTAANEEPASQTTAEIDSEESGN